MLVTLSAMTIDLRLLQSSNAWYPMVVTPSGITMPVNLLHPIEGEFADGGDAVREGDGNQF